MSVRDIKLFGERKDIWNWDCKLLHKGRLVEPDLA